MNKAIEFLKKESTVNTNNATARIICTRWNVWEVTLPNEPEYSSAYVYLDESDFELFYK